MERTHVLYRPGTPLRALPSVVARRAPFNGRPHRQSCVAARAAPKLRPLLIDNYDSYTYNLYQIIAEVYGVTPLVLSNDAADIGQIQQLLASGSVAHIILSPGPGSPHTPSDIGVCLDVLRVCTSTPLLGVCLGHQALAAAAGASVVAAPEPVHGRLSTLTHSGHELFRGCPSGHGSGLDVVRYHSLVVESAGLPDVLEPLAWTCGQHTPLPTQQQRRQLGSSIAAAPGGAWPAAAAGAWLEGQQQQHQQQQQQLGSGQELIMALRHKHRPHYGVQFHPESIATRYGIQLLINFRDLAYRTSGHSPPTQLDHTYSQGLAGAAVGPPGRHMPPRPWPAQQQPSTAAAASAAVCSASAITAASLPSDSRAGATQSPQQQEGPQEQQQQQQVDVSSLGPCAGVGALQLAWLKLPGQLAGLSGGSTQLFTSLVGPGPDTFWLDSACAPERARFSFMGGAALRGPLAHRVAYKLPPPHTSGSTGGSCGTAEPCLQHQQQPPSSSGSCGGGSFVPGLLSISRGGGAAGSQQQQVRVSIWDYLQAQLATLQLLPECAAAAAAALPFNFWGGFVGYLGYELKAECGGAAAHAAPGPDAAWLFADRLLVVDHQEGDIYLLALHQAAQAAQQAAASRQHSSSASPSLDPAAAAWQWLSDTADKVAALLTPASQPSGTTAAPVIAAAAVDAAPPQQQQRQQQWPASDMYTGYGTSSQHPHQQQLEQQHRSNHHHQQQQQTSLAVELRHDRPAYTANVAACQAALVAGHSYELCLTTAFTLRQPPHPWAYYQTLRSINPAPYAAWLSIAGDTPGDSSTPRTPAITVCCSSPERFLSGGRGGGLEAKPIKGTAPRHPDDPAADAASAAALLSSEKERAENLMIVDLLRNDLGKVCEPGSVHVPGLIQLESYATVHQLVSTVRGLRRADACCVEALRAAFPGGSMTGAPKVRSMELLDGLEGAARGVYSGALGYLSINDTFDMNIVIRTAVFMEEGGGEEGGAVQAPAGEQGSSAGAGSDSGGQVHQAVAVRRVMSVGAGGAVVVQSEPQAEFAEMQLKAQQLLKTAALAQQQQQQQQ